MTDMKLTVLTFSFLLFSAPLRLSAGHLQDSVTDGNTVRRDSVTVKTSYDQRILKYHKKWTSLIPRQFIIQNAGNMGAISIGLGWNYGMRKNKHRQWETQLLFGYIPKYKSNRGKITTTLKQNYIPWSVDMKKNIRFEPLRCGLYVNTVFGHEFWEHQPTRYPKKYYDFLSTEFRFNIFVGEGFTKVIPKNNRKFIKNFTLFYEISSCDLYIRSMCLDHNVKLKDILGLSLGVKLQLL